MTESSATESRLRVVILAAGRGTRMGADKAKLDLGDGTTTLARMFAALDSAASETGVRLETRLVRHPSHRDPDLGRSQLARTLERIVVDSDDMLTSLRAGLVDFRPEPTLVWPVDHAMVSSASLTALIRAGQKAGDQAILLPRHGERVGHPVHLGASLIAELDTRGPFAESTGSLRDLIRRDSERVEVVDVTDSWIWRDLDEPSDLRAARGALLGRQPTIETMRSHRSRRAYSDENVSVSQVRALVDAARHASTSSFLQGATIVSVRDPEKKSEVARLCGSQPHIDEAPVFLAICADLHRPAKACEQRGVRLHHEALETFVQATVDAALVGQNLQLAAESEGLGACMIGAARNEPEALAELLGLPPHVYVVFGMTLGWPSDDPLPRERLPLRAVLHDEVYDRSGTDSALATADEQLRDWSRRTNERAAEGVRRIDEQRGWADRLAYLFGGDEPPKGRGRLGEALRRLGFGLKL